MELNLIQDSFELIQESVNSKVYIKGFASTSTIDRENEVVADPREFDVITFKNSPQLLVDHDYIKTKEGNSVSAGLITKAIPSYIKTEIDGQWAVFSLCSDEFVSLWPKEKSVDLSVGSKGLFVVAEVTQPFAIELVKKGELGAFSWRGLAAKEVVNGVTVIKSIDLLEISIVRIQAERNSTFTIIDEEDPTHKMNVDFTDCTLSSMKFSKSAYSIDQINHYTKQFSIDKYSISENEDSYFLKIGETGLVDTAKCFTFCKSEGVSVIAAPIKRRSILEMPLVKETNSTTENPMENTEVQNLLLVDIEQFQKLKGVEIKTLGEKEIDGNPVVIHAAFVSEQAEDSQKDLDEETLDTQEETLEAEQPADEVEAQAEETQAEEPTSEDQTEEDSDEVEVVLESQESEETDSPDFEERITEMLSDVLLAVKNLKTDVDGLQEAHKALDQEVKESQKQLENSVKETLKNHVTKEDNAKTLDKLERAFKSFGNQVPEKETRKEQSQKSFGQEDGDNQEKAYKAFDSILFSTQS